MIDELCCRICNEPNNLIKVCKCTGSIEGIHKECIVQWLEYKWPNGEWKKKEELICEICKCNINIPMTIMERFEGLYAIIYKDLNEYWVQTKKNYGLNLLMDYKLVWILMHLLLASRYSFSYVYYFLYFAQIYLFLFTFLIKNCWNLYIVDHKLKLEIIKNGIIRFNTSLAQLAPLKPGCILESTNYYDNTTYFHRQKILILKYESQSVIGIVLNKELKIHDNDRDFIFKSGGPVLAQVVVCLCKRPRDKTGWVQVMENVWYRFVPLSTDLVTRLHKGVFYFMGFASWFDNQLAGELSSGMWILRNQHESQLWEELGFEYYYENQQLEWEFYEDDDYRIKYFINDLKFSTYEYDHEDSEEEIDLE